MTTVPTPLDLDAIEQRAAKLDEACDRTPASLGNLMKIGGAAARSAADVPDLLAEVKRLTKGIEDTVAALRAAAMAEGGQPAYSFAAGLNDGLQLATARLRALLDGPR